MLCSSPTLTRRGHDVVIFEKGPEYPYPHEAQFREQVLYLHESGAYRLPPDLMHHTFSGSYRYDLDEERAMVVGGSATKWQAVTPRMAPEDFQTRSRYGYGEDWPLTYEELEPFYCRAEELLGVAGTDADNPFAPRRSKPYPLPPFPLSYDDRILAGRLRAAGITLHTTPQARTSRAYDGRPGCVNYGTCRVCPIGARYSPAHHLGQAERTGRCRVRPQTSVRRIVLERGRARALVYRENESATDQEHAARVIIVAAGAIESARLLLLSAGGAHPDGPGNAGGHVGKHLIFHHLWAGRLRYKERLFPGRLGPYTGQSYQFRDPPGRGRHGGTKVEFSAHLTVEPRVRVRETTTGAAIVDAMEEIPHWRVIKLHSESVPGLEKWVGLSERRDRFGDPFAHVRYVPEDFDHETYRFAREVFDRFASSTGAAEAHLDEEASFTSASHHMGTCRMGRDVRDSVVDSFGRVHGLSNLFVAGGSAFVGTSAVNPTLTMVALAVRTAESILQLL